jgi:hypothetical protein
MSVVSNLDMYVCKPPPVVGFPYVAVRVVENRDDLTMKTIGF